MLDAIKTHQYRCLQINVVLHIVIREVGRRCHPVFVRLINQDAHLFRGSLFDFDT